MLVRWFGRSLTDTRRRKKTYIPSKQWRKKRRLCKWKFVYNIKVAANPFNGYGSPNNMVQRITEIRDNVTFPFFGKLSIIFIVS